MTGYLPGEPSSHEGGGPNTLSPDKQEEVAGRWYMSRKEIEENSPSRGDFIDLKRETYLRKSYCTFLQDLGMRLKVPQVTIATAIIFCHRFFLRQSHAKNDRRTIATVCMFLAGKVEETPRPIKDVILVSYEIINKKDPAAAQRIKQKEVYEQQKELILLGERVVLATLGFDLNVLHPYKPLVEAIKKFKVAQNALAQVAWNFVNDGLRTSLCLQFKPHHIAAGAIFLAAKFLKVKLPSDGEKVWWQEFDVTPRQLEEVSNQMLELYEQNRVPPSQGSEVESNQNHRTPAKINDEEHTPNSGIVMKPGSLRQSSSRSAPDHSDPPRSVQHQSNENGSVDMGGSVITDHKVDEETKAENARDETTEAKSTLHKSGGVRNLELRESGLVGQSPKEAIKMIDKDKVKAAIEKRKKSRGEMTMKKDVMDEDALIEKELEEGIELENKRERRFKNEDPHIVEEGEMLDDGVSSPVLNSRKRKGSPVVELDGSHKYSNNHESRNHGQENRL